MNKLFLSSVAALWIGVFEIGLATQAQSQTPTAVIVPNGFTLFTDANGKPLSNGTVYLYVPGTTTSKTTWKDPYQSIVNTNPIVLDGAGQALIWGSGIYRQVVYDVNTNLIWDQLTGGYNCVGGGAVPLGANGALQYNNGGVFGGLALGNSGQVLFGNASGPPTWGAPPAGSVDNLTGLGAGVLAALKLPLDGTGALCAQTGCTLDSPIINNPTISGGTWNNPTFTGTITGLPGGGGSSSCTDRTGAALAHCIGSAAIFNMELGTDPIPGGTGHAIVAWMTGLVAAWDVYEAPGLLEAEAQVAEAHKNVASIPTLADQIKQLAAATHTKLK